MEKRAMSKLQLGGLADREEIRDCLFRYSRGIDRADEAALTAAYWPDAYDNHGAYAGPVSGFFDLARSVWASGARNIHHITNILIEFQGEDRAAVESYFFAFQRGIGPDNIERQVQLSGRYCDLFERRGEEWRILSRTVVYDWVDPQPVPEKSEEERFGPRKPIGAPFPDDPVYGIGRKTEEV